MDRVNEGQDGCSSRDPRLKGNDVAKILNISRSFAFQVMQNGEIPTVRIGRSVRVRPVDLNNFIDKCVGSK